MTNQEKLDQAQKLLATGRHQDRKEAQRLLSQVKKQEKQTAVSQQGKLF